MNAQLTEIMRLITNLIRTGVVTEVDRANWLCRVKTGDLETNWINWLTLRAGKSRTLVETVCGVSRLCCSVLAAIWKPRLPCLRSTQTSFRHLQALRTAT